MRRFCVLTLLVLGLLTIILGFAEAHAQPGELPVAHITVAVLFVVLCLVHIVINRKAVLKYIRGK
jgi:hypothetical protein